MAKKKANMKLQIQIYRGTKLLDDNTVMVGEAWLRRWKLPTQTPITLRFGSVKREVRLVSVSGLAGARIGNSLASRMGLFDGLQLLTMARGRLLRLGPLIGVLVSRVYQRNHEAPFGAMTAFCREMTEACRLYGGYVVFFTPDDLPGTSASTMSAWTYEDRWVKREVPIPDVVYNRLTSRRFENQPSVKHFMTDVKNRFGTAIFNEKYLDKTEVFAALSQEPLLKPYLPESHQFKNYQMLKSMLSRHKTVFLKPVTGSLGKGIIRLVQTEGGTIVHTTLVGGVRRQSFPTLTQAFQSITGKLRQQKYQIQQGLKLMEAGGSPLDFRSLVQKGRSGEWSITSIVARIAPSGSFVSNVARGGTLSPLREALAKLSLSTTSRAAVTARLRKASLDIAGGIEKRIPAHFGELGIDLAADQNGHVWLLEVNSKPSKDDNTPLQEGKIRPSVRRIIEYAQYIAQF